MQYRAFISYSHADAQFAAWLQRAIETWRVPRRLRERLGLSSLSPVFRDRSDLSAASSLPESITHSLMNSAVLLVVCSPDAAKSEWVSREIDRFRELQPTAPIIPIIASGNPPDCFPKALLRDASGKPLEPIAADARKGFDGRRDALLKTIAGMLNVGFDELKQRELHRKNRRMAALSLLSTCIASVTIILAIVASQARDTAERRREQADGLIEFMLGDLRGRLEPIGKLEVLNSVGDRALTYFSELDGDEFTPQVSLNHARALRQIGEVRMAQGQFDAALNAFQISNDTSSAVVEAEPDDLEAFYESAQSTFWIGYVHMEREQYSLARPSFEKYLSIGTQLFETGEGGDRYRQEYTYGLQNMGALEEREGNLAKAAEYIDAALAILKRLIAADPKNISTLDEVQGLYSWRGSVASQAGQLKEAQKWYSLEYNTVETILTIEETKQNEELLALSALRLAAINLYLGEIENSAEYATYALQESEALSEYDPSNFWWKQMLARCLARHAKVLEVKGLHASALASTLRAGNEYKLMLGRDGLLSDHKREHAEVLVMQARLEYFTSDFSASQGSLEKAISVLNEQESQENSRDASLIKAEALLVKGDVLKKQGNEQASHQLWQAGLQFVRTEAGETEGVNLLVLRAMLLERLELTKEAQAAWAKITSSDIDHGYARSFGLQ